MVFYLSESGDGIRRYAETDAGVMDVPQESYQQKMEYADVGKIDPSALEKSASVREQGYWLKPETMPKQYLWANGDEPIPDVLPGFVVSPRFKDLVESFEPGIHQFIAVDIYKRRDNAPVATYYWFIVGQRLDSVDRERTTYAWQEGKRGVWVDSVVDTKTWIFTRIPDARLVFSNAQVAGHHIWHDPHLLSFGNGLCSDAFAEALLASGLTGVAATPRESV